MSETIFAKIIRKEIPASILYEDERALAFKDINPAAPFHALVIPKPWIENVGGMQESDAALVGHLMYVCQLVAKQAGHSEFRIVSNSGEAAGQTVFHLHFHVLAGRSLSWPPG